MTISASRVSDTGNITITHEDGSTFTEDAATVKNWALDLLNLCESIEKDAASKLAGHKVDAPSAVTAGELNHDDITTTDSLS